MYETRAVKDILSERFRQKNVKKYNEMNDDLYEQNELLRAAQSYLNHVVGRGWVYDSENHSKYVEEDVPDFFPWENVYWKPKNPRQDLIRVAALIIAEIERMDRVVIKGS